MYKFKIIQKGNGNVIAESTLTEAQVQKAFSAKFNPLRNWINLLTGVGERKGRQFIFSFNENNFAFEGGKIGRNLEKTLMLWIVEQDPNKGFFADEVKETAKELVKGLPLSVEAFNLAETADNVADGSKSIKGLHSNASKLIDLSQEEVEEEEE